MMDDVISQAAEELAEKVHLGIKVRMEMALKPRPWWMPRFVYGYLINLLLNVEVVVGDVK